MPKYDFKCSRCDLVFEGVRSFAEAADPALCPRDGASAGRVFTPPAEILVRGGFRDSVDRRAASARPTWSHEDLSCHTHEPAPTEQPHDHGNAGDDAPRRGREPGDRHSHDHGHSHAHGHNHAHGHGHHHPR